MSRTKKGKKPIGYDYWGKRPYSTNYGFGPIVKKLTHKVERLEAKKLARKEAIEGCHSMGVLFR